MTNRELYFRDPTTLELLNNGVSKVSEIGHDAIGIGFFAGTSLLHQSSRTKFELTTRP